MLTLGANNTITFTGKLTIKHTKDITKQQFKQQYRAERLQNRKTLAKSWRITRRLYANLVATVRNQTEPAIAALREVDDMIASGINCLPSMYHQRPVAPYGKDKAKPALPVGLPMPSNKVSCPAFAV